MTPEDISDEERAWMQAQDVTLTFTMKSCEAAEFIDMMDMALTKMLMEVGVMSLLSNTAVPLLQISNQGSPQLAAWMEQKHDEWKNRDFAPDPTA